MTKADMILQADKLNIANKDDLFDAILSGKVTETMLKELQDSLQDKETIECENQPES